MVVETETRRCQNCKKEFAIEVADFAFYEKIKVPAPTWCPECRMIRRFSFTNIWNLYKRACAKCGKSTLSIHAPEKELIVYCQICWWAQDWDGLEYGMDYDSSRPFLEQVRELARKTPWQALDTDHSTLVNSEYTNAVAHIKNCYLTFWADFCENVYYSSLLNGLKESLDCYRMKESELCYEDVDCTKCFRAFFSEECASCTDIWFSRSCTNCTNCFGCINLRGKSYYIFNQPHSREEYFEKLKEFRLDSREALTEIRKKVRTFWNQYPRRSYTGNSLNVNVSGDYIYESKNTHDAFMVSGVQDSRFVQILSVAPTRDSYDYTGWGNGAERMYEASVVGEKAGLVKFSNECWPDVFDIEYSMYANACKHTFGCVNLKKKDYCILNKQYPKEEYERLVGKIRDDMKKRPYHDAAGRKWFYGEFFPLEFSPFAYNETLANQFFPKTKEEAEAQGFRWREGEETKYAVTKNGSDLPDTATDVDDVLLRENIGCSECGRAFRFVQGELNLMQKLRLPLPSRCPNCRSKARFNRTNLPRLYDRTCAKCGKQIRTSYAPDRAEIVYCEQCYQSEIL